MKILIILAHPSPGSFNHAIVKTMQDILKSNKHEVYFHDLYKEKFSPLLPAKEISKQGKIDSVIRKHCNELKAVDGMIFVHPNWWGQPPAILKGWIDRVIRPGIAYEFAENDQGDGVPLGLLKEKIALVFNTSDTPDEREKQVFGDPLEAIWKKCIFELCGITQYYRKMFNVVVTSTAEERQKWLVEIRGTINKYFPVS